MSHSRADWPVRWHRLGEEPPEDLSDVTTPAARLAMMARLAHEGWTLTGRPLPNYTRADAPTRLRDLLTAFGAEGVEFVIVGAYALALHGVPRFTGDLDIYVRPVRENASRVWRALLRFGAPVDAAGLAAEDFTTPGIVYQIGLPPRRIDILTQISGVTFEEAWATRETADLDGTPVHFIGRDAFLRNKLAAGRPKDLADAARLKR